MDIEAPKILKKPIKIPIKHLMGPGPSNCSPRVLHALGQNVVAPMLSEVFQAMDEIKEGLKYVFQTRNELTLAISASGHAGMEAVMSNLIEPGDKVLILISGIWGERASNMAVRYGANVVKLSSKLGTNFSLEEIHKSIHSVRPKLLFVAQGESSTGILQPLEGLGDICQRYDCLLAVDTVASLGGVPFFMDKWKIDVVYTGSQKVLSVPPGITPISFSAKAQNVIFTRKTPIPVYYWDMKILGQQWNCFNNIPPYHHTVCSNLLFALREGLSEIVEEGLENLIRRHTACAKRLYAGLEQLNLELFVENFNDRLPTITTITIPKDIDWEAVVSYAMTKYSLEIGGGLGPTTGKVFRIGILGYNATPENVDFVLKVFKEALNKSAKAVSKL